ncbi:MAG: EamA family transporter [Planctomycetes bacterium]|nr:EamA family transporter [Planctomycetota bacterium]
MKQAVRHHVPLAGVLAAFGVVYVVWGSTYLAIRYAVETVPPFLAAGVRFLVAGLLFYPFVRRRERAPLKLRNWVAAGLAGCLMLVGGNGLVCWSEQYVASGLAALLVATVPLWFVLLEWLVFGGGRPNRAVLAGVAVGLFGVFWLIGPGNVGGARADLRGAVALVFACLFWSVGSLYARRAPVPQSTPLTTAIEMLAAGVVLTLISGVLGEWSRVEWQRITLRSVLSLAYLSLFGSILAFTCYGWLLRVSTPARVATYAYVNPVIAVFLGTIFAAEPLTPRVLLAAAIIVTAVAIITTYAPRRSAAAPTTTQTPDDGPASPAEEPPSCGAALPAPSCVSLEPRLGPTAMAVSLPGDPDGAVRVYRLSDVLARRGHKRHPYLEFLRLDTLSAGVYELPADGVDRQRPHTEDEAYYVLAGRARFSGGGNDVAVSAGTFIFVERGVEHRFHDIAEDLTVLVFFAPAETSNARETGRQLCAADFRSLPRTGTDGL